MSLMLAAGAVRRRRPGRFTVVLLTLVMLPMLVASTAAFGIASRLRGHAFENPLEAVPAQCASANTDAPAKSRNAATVANTGAALGVARPGLVIGIAVTLVEAGGLNLASQAVPESLSYPNDGVAPGDHDSVGIFQQRASWGSVEQRMNVQYAATKFFERLKALNPPWDTRDPGAAGQAVQISAFPDRYATKMVEAEALLAGGVTLVPCNPPAPTGGGAGFTDGPAGAYPGLTRTPAEAIAWARAREGADGWYRRCLAFVTQATGSWVGVPYAIDAYHVTPADRRHAADSPEGRTPPPGAALFYDTGQRAGHVVLYLGGGLIASNDIVTPGIISVVPADAIETRWGSRYVGWAWPGSN